MKKGLCLLVVVQFWQVDFVTGNFTLTEADLHNKLFKHYRTSVIPLKDRSKPIKVSVGFNVISIQAIDEKRQTISVQGFFHIAWKDELLVWEPEAYGGIQTINVPTNDIWTPDVTLDRKFGKPTDIGIQDVLASVQNDGSVKILPYQIFTIGCDICIRRFPFDVQTCELNVEPWTHSSITVQLDMISDRIGMLYFNENSEWDLIDKYVYKYVSTEYPHGYDHVVFALKLRRKWLFFLSNTLLPVVFTSFLNVLCFLLPVSSGERVSMNISIFLSLNVCLTLVTQQMPESSDEVAIFSVYVSVQLAVSMLNLLMNVLSIRLYHRAGGGKQVHGFYKTLTKISYTPHQWKNNKVGEVFNIADKPTGVPQDEEKSGKILFKDADASKKVQENAYDVTWVMVSVATDRLCFGLGVFWHVASLFILLICTNVS